MIEELDSKGQAVGSREEIRVFVEGPTSRQTIMTQKDGRFRLWGLFPGRYRVTPTLPKSFWPVSQTATLKRNACAELGFLATPRAHNGSSGTEFESMKALPKSEDIFTIAINSIPSAPTSTSRFFTPQSLREALPNFRPGEAEIKVGDRRVWESGVIVLNNKKVLFWTTCRKIFIHVLRSDAYVSFIIGDGKDDP
jgi:hypothetical protein